MVGGSETEFTAGNTEVQRVSVCAVFTSTSEMLCQQQDGGEAPLMHIAGKEREEI